MKERVRVRVGDNKKDMQVKMKIYFHTIHICIHTQTYNTNEKIIIKKKNSHTHVSIYAWDNGSFKPSSLLSRIVTVGKRKEKNK